MFVNYSKKKNRNYQSHAISKYKLNFIGSFQIKMGKDNKQNNDNEVCMI